MKISFKILKKWWFWVGFVFTTLIILLYLFLQLRFSDTAFSWWIDDNDYPLEIEHYKIGNRNMRFAKMGKDNAPLVVALHGTPGSSADWRNLYNDSSFVNKVKLIAVDRPGYGYSDFGNVETSLKVQAELIAPILKKYRKTYETVVVLGFSYGGPVAARLAMDYPDLMDGLILLSAAVAPGEEKIYSISYPTTTKWLEWLVPTAITNANYEKLSHRETLLKMKPYWNKIKAVTTIIHSDSDDLVYPENAHFAEQNLKNAPIVKKIMLPNKHHALPFTEADLVRKLLLEAVERTQNYQKIKSQE